MNRVWKNETGYEVQLRLSARRSIHSLFVLRDGRVVVSLIYQWWEEAKATAEAEQLARMGHMLEINPATGHAEVPGQEEVA